MQNEPIEESIKVVSGSPTPAELAAVIAILKQAHAEQVSDSKHRAKPSRSSWNRNSGQLRTGITPGSGQWVASVRPGLD